MTSTEVTTKPSPAQLQRDALRAELQRFAPSYQALLPEGYDPSALITGALIAATRTPEILQCTPLSVATALATIAQWGGIIGITAHLVPYGQQCTPIADYKLFIAAICEAGARKVEARVVREGDVFEYGYGTEPYLRHHPKSDTEKIIAAYAIVWLRSGVPQFEVVTATEIEKIRQEHSKAWKKGPLTKWYARKTAIRQIAKYVPKTPRLSRVLQDDEMPAVDLETGEILGSPFPPASIEGPRGVRDDGYEAFAPPKEPPDLTVPLDAVSAAVDGRTPLLLPGVVSDWMGWGGKPIREAPDSALIRARDKLGKIAAYAETVAAIEEELERRRAEAEVGDAFEEAK
jgi:recombination protein RecT